MSLKFNEIMKEKLIELYITGEKISDIAKLLNVERQTIYNWLEKEEVKGELDKRRRHLGSQGNEFILKDLKTYIDNVKELANDKSDKRTSLSANQYLINRIYGNPNINVVNSGDNGKSEVIEEDKMDEEIDSFDEEFEE